MPFQSEAQRRYLHAKHPDVAKRFEEHEAAEESEGMAEGGEVQSEDACPHCGQAYSAGGEVEEAPEADAEEAPKRSFIEALRAGRGT